MLCSLKTLDYGDNRFFESLKIFFCPQNRIDFWRRLFQSFACWSLDFRFVDDAKSWRYNEVVMRCYRSTVALSWFDTALTGQGYGRFTFALFLHKEQWLLLSKCQSRVRYSESHNQTYNHPLSPIRVIGGQPPSVGGNTSKKAYLNCRFKSFDY